MKYRIITLWITLWLIVDPASPVSAAGLNIWPLFTRPPALASPVLPAPADILRPAASLTSTLGLTATHSAQVITGHLERTEAQQANPWRTYAKTDCIQNMAAIGQEVWVATCGGVLRWDPAGGSYIHYTNADGLPNNEVQGLAVDPAGHVWVRTRKGGVGEFNGQAWINHAFQESEVDGYDNRAITVDQAGHIWVYTTGGLREFANQTWTTYPLEADLAQQSIHAMVGDPAGNIWLSTSGGLGKFDGQTWTRYTTATGLVSDNVNALAVDQAGHIWVGTAEGVNRFDGQNWTTYTTADGLIDNWITDIAIDPAGQVWVSHRGKQGPYVGGQFLFEGGGVSKFDGQRWTTYTQQEGLAGASIEAIAVDPLGRLWFGSGDGALSQFAEPQWTTYQTAGSLVNNEVFAVTIDQAGHRWFGTRTGASRFDGQGWTSYTTVDGLADDEVSAIAVDQRGQPWFGTWTGLSRLAGQTWTTYTDAWINTLAIDPAGQVWVGTNSEGLSRFDGQTWTTYTSEDGLPGNSIEAMAIDPAGRPWLGTGSGLLQFDGQRWTPYTTTTDLVSAFPTALAAGPAGQFWVGTLNGALKFDGQTWSTYTITNGLASNHVTGVAMDPAGHTWVATYGGGVSEFDGCAWTTYTTADGLASNQVTAVAVDEAGHKWFATSNGVSELSESLAAPTSPVDLAGRIAVCTLLVGPGQPGRLYALVDAAVATRLLISDDFGQTWQPFPGGLPVEPACLGQVSLDYAPPETLYASTCRGLYRWSGQAWTLVSPQLTGQVAMVYQQPERLWAIAPTPAIAPGLLYSDDGGQSWDEANHGLANFKDVADVAVASGDSNIVYALVQFPRSGGYLYRGRAGSSWLALPSPKNNSPLNSGLALDGASGALYVTTHAEGSQLWRSLNPTALDATEVQWELVHDFGLDVQAELLASGWSPKGLALYANLTDRQVGRPVLHRSLDGGQTWTTMPIEF